MTDARAITADGGHLLANIMHFARVLRAAGLPIGPGTVVDAVQAVRPPEFRFGPGIQPAGYLTTIPCISTSLISFFKACSDIARSSSGPT